MLTQVERSLLTRRVLLHILEYISLANGSAIRMLGMKRNVRAQHAKLGVTRMGNLSIPIMVKVSAMGIS